MVKARPICKLWPILPGNQPRFGGVFLCSKGRGVHFLQVGPYPRGSGGAQGAFEESPGMIGPGILAAFLGDSQLTEPDFLTRARLSGPC